MLHDTLLHSNTLSTSIKVVGYLCPQSRVLGAMPVKVVFVVSSDNVKEVVD